MFLKKLQEPYSFDYALLFEHGKWEMCIQTTILNPDSSVYNKESASSDWSYADILF